MKKLAILILAILALACPDLPAQTKPAIPDQNIDTDIKNIRDNSIATFRHTYDDYLQYSPAVLMLALKTSGYKSRSSWGRMIVSDAFAVGLMAISVNGIKYTVKRLRPDISSRNSFPSGHTATAFMAASMLHKEYGWKSPWFTIGGYTVAAATGVSRIMNNRHWMSDVFAGALIGVGSVQLGYFLADLIFKDRQLYDGYEHYNPYYYDFDHCYWNVELFCGKRFVIAGNHAITRGGTMGIQADIPVISRAGVSLRAGANSLAGHGDSFNVYNVLAGGQYNLPFAKVLEFQARAMAGYWFSRNNDGLDLAAGVSIGVITCRNIKIKAFAEYESFCSFTKYPTVHSVTVGYSTAVCW